MKFIVLTQSEQRYNQASGEYENVRTPIAVNIDQVREFYPRRRGEGGTRLSMFNGAGIIVKQTYEQVKTAMESTGMTFADAGEAPADPVVTRAQEAQEETEGPEGDGDEIPSSVN